QSESATCALDDDAAAVGLFEQFNEARRVGQGLFGHLDRGYSCSGFPRAVTLGGGSAAVWQGPRQRHQPLPRVAAGPVRRPVARVRIPDRGDRVVLGGRARFLVDPAGPVVRRRVADIETDQTGNGSPPRPLQPTPALAAPQDAAADLNFAVTDEPRQA